MELHRPVESLPTAVKLQDQPEDKPLTLTPNPCLKISAKDLHARRKKSQVTQKSREHAGRREMGGDLRGQCARVGGSGGSGG